MVQPLPFNGAAEAGAFSQTAGGEERAANYMYVCCPRVGEARVTAPAGSKLGQAFTEVKAFYI